MNQPVKSDAKKINPFAVAAGQRAFLLVPYEETARNRTLELLAAKGFNYESEEERRDKQLPKVVFQMKLSKLQSEDVLFSAVPVPEKMGQKKQASSYALKLSPAVEAKKFIAGDEDGDVAPGAIADALQAHVHPMTLRIGQDHILKIFPF